MDREEALSLLRAALAPGARGAEFARVAKSVHPADIAAWFAELPPEEARSLLGQLAAPARAQIFGYLDAEFQALVAQRLDRRELGELFLHMSHDERADLFRRIPEAQSEAFLPALAHAEREDIRRLAEHPEGTVGAVMTSDYATLAPGLAPPEAIEHLRMAAPDAETIYQAYVLGGERRLLGTVSLKDLILAPSHARVEELMDASPVSVRADAPREEAARLVSRYDLIALPVLDERGTLVGIVTHDDAMDVAEAEATEDFGKVGAVEQLAVSLKGASVRHLYRKRVFWLMVLVFGNLFSGAGIAYFEDTIATYVALVFFLPLLIDSGGNAGSQSATLMVRALATGEVALKDWAGMVSRELAVAVLLGATMAVAVSALGIWRGGPEIALVVSLSMLMVVVAGSVIGMSLPFLLSHLRLDPAVASSPLITSIADAVGVVVYFAMATMLLGQAAG
jgi:magnesium transporter